MENPSHIYETMSMLGIFSLRLMLEGILIPVGVWRPASLLPRLALCVSVVDSFLVFGGGVVSDKLVMSIRESDVTAWLGAAKYSSSDVES